MQNPNWFEAFATRTASTNNALESFNRVVKDEYTYRERLDVGRFRFVLYRMITQWSVEYKSKINNIRNELTLDELSLDLKTSGYQ